MAIGKEAFGASPHPHKPSTLERFIKSRTFRLGLALGAMGTAGYEAHQNIPAVQRGVESLQNEVALHWNSIVKSAEPVKTFTNDKTSGYMGTTNTFPIDLETANIVLNDHKRFQLADETTLIFPLRLPKGSGTTYTFQERLKEFDPKTGKNIMTDNRNWMILSKVPKGTEIYTPRDGIIYTGRPSKDGLVDGIGLEFVENGTKYTLKIGGYTTDLIFKPLDDIPLLPDYVKTGKTRQVKQGETILQLALDGYDIQLEYTSTPVGSAKNAEKPVPLRFLTATDNTATEKLLVLTE